MSPGSRFDTLRMGQSNFGQPGRAFTSCTAATASREQFVFPRTGNPSRWRATGKCVFLSVGEHHHERPLIRCRAGRRMRTLESGPFPELRPTPSNSTWAKKLLQDSPRIELDLGEVREVARVFLNGEEVGISSFAPHVLDITRRIRQGENSLTIEVANTWLNRLIADEALPQDQRLTHTNLDRGPKLGQRCRDAEPLPSGHLGPVRLRFPRQFPITKQ